MVVVNALELPFQQCSVHINLNLVEMYLMYLITNYCFSEFFSVPPCFTINGLCAKFSRPETDIDNTVKLYI